MRWQIRTGTHTLTQTKYYNPRCASWLRVNNYFITNCFYSVSWRNIYLPAAEAAPGDLIAIVHPESFRSNTQIAIAFAHRNRPRVHRNDEFACVYLRSCAFVFAFVCEYCSRSTACAYVRAYARTCMRSRVRTYVRDVNSI